MVAHRPHSYGLAALLVVLLIFLCSRGGGGSGGGNGNNNGNGGSSAAGGGFLRWRPLLLFSQAQAEDDPLLPPLRAPVPQIDEEEFEQLVHSKRPVLVDFFAPWCGHCKTMAPLYDEASVQMFSQPPEVNPPTQLVKVDCMIERSLCARFNINAFPALRLIRRGEGEGIDAPLRVYTFGMQRSTLSFLVFCSTVWKSQAFTSFPELEHIRERTASADEAQQRHEQEQALLASESLGAKLTLEQRWELQEAQRRRDAGEDVPLPVFPKQQDHLGLPKVLALPEENTVTTETQPQQEEQQQEQPPQDEPTPAAAAEAVAPPSPTPPSSQAAAGAASAAAASSLASLRKPRRLRRPEPRGRDSPLATPPAAAAAAIVPSSPPSVKSGGGDVAAAAATDANNVRDEPAAAMLTDGAVGGSVEAQGMANPDVLSLSSSSSDPDASAAAPVPAAPRSSRVWWGVLGLVSSFAVVGGVYLRRHWTSIRRRYNRHQSLVLGKGV